MDVGNTLLDNLERTYVEEEVGRDCLASGP